MGCLCIDRLDLFARHSHEFVATGPDNSDPKVSMIGEGSLGIEEEYRNKDDWAARHRFRLKLRSFRGVRP